MVRIKITPPEGNSEEFPGNGKELGTPADLFRDLLEREPSVEGVLTMMQYKLYCKESKYNNPLEFLDSEDKRLIDDTWDALMSKGWKLEILP